uniref:Diacylglycerol kinase n=1 Tax=Malurus cyaneus samueli TaxID=2593467 RepID=A0A8C5TD49_9PASS
MLPVIKALLLLIGGQRTRVTSECITNSSMNLNADTFMMLSSSCWKVCGMCITSKLKIKTNKSSILYESLLCRSWHGKVVFFLCVELVAALHPWQTFSYPYASCNVTEARLPLFLSSHCTDTYHHHWREGNLSSSARCEVCKKTCGSSEVLSGMRCEWCGILAHAACYVIVTPECTFGRLRNMILPPSCVQLFSRNFSKLHCFRISENLQTESGKNFKASKIPRNCCPLLVFVNPKSGGLKGRDLLYSFRKLLNPHQVFELTNGGPLKCTVIPVTKFHTFSKVPSFRVLVCGGDGTVGWVLGALEEIRHKLVCSEPSVAILPLGTGNDLGRVLRWGAGYSGEDPYSILVSVDEADDVLMDRWTILLDAEEPAEGMNNYCGLGIDAELSLDFHHAREEEPGKFNSRFHNKGVYVKVGLQKISHTRNLHKDIKLQVDQHEVELPSIEGLIFINIPSWGSGADLWGSESDNRFEKPRIDDGLLEVVGVTGVVHMVINSKKLTQPLRCT